MREAVLWPHRLIADPVDSTIDNVYYDCITIRFARIGRCDRLRLLRIPDVRSAAREVESSRRARQ